jgi:flagellar hook-associated protein 1 FlgK
VGAVVERINSLGMQIASLNKQIHQFELDGSHANDLRDQRALLVDKLSEYVNIDVQEMDYGDDSVPFDKRYVILINGYDFVNHFQVQTLECVPRTPDLEAGQTSEQMLVNYMDVPELYDIVFKGIGTKFDIYSSTLQGTLKGLIDVRDGNNNDPNTLNTANPDATNTTAYKGIPFYMEKLNVLVRTFARAVNEGLDVNGSPIRGIDGTDITGHVNGYDKDGVQNGTRSGLYLFTGFTYNGVTPPEDDSGPALDYNDINCVNFIVNPQLLDNPYKLATSSLPFIGESNNDVIHGFSIIAAYPSLFREGKLVDFIIGTADHLAIDRMQARKFDESYYEMTLMTDNQRLSVMGVDINEEMMSLTRYNQLFVACSRLINVIDQCYDTMINRMGNF